MDAILLAYSPFGCPNISIDSVASLRILQPPMKHTIADNLRELRGRIAEACEQYDRDADDITIVAVTKSFPAEIIQRAVAIGLYDIGESKVQEAEQKITELGHIARFHLIGHLQSNK